MTHDPLSDLLGPGPDPGRGRRAHAGTDTNPGSDPTAGSDPVPPGPDDRGDPDDEDIAEIPPRRRVPLLTACLVGSIALGLAFTGGVLVQKRHDSGSTAAASGLPSGLAGFPGGSAGIPSGLSGLPGTGSAVGSGGNAGMSAGASSGPVLVGTVVKVDGMNVTVKDLSGKTYVVRTTTSTTLTRSVSIPTTSLKAGDAVSVEGTKSGQSVSASAVTDRGQ